MTRDDFLVGHRNLVARVRVQAKRCQTFKATARAALGGQLRFDFADADSRYADLEDAPLLASVSAGAGSPPARDKKDTW